MYFVKNTFSQTGENIGIDTASIDFRKEFTEADLKGLTELVKVFEALEKEEPVEQKRAPVDEIVKEKEILNDQRSSSENVVQDQYAPSNTLTSLIDERIKIKVKGTQDEGEDEPLILVGRIQANQVIKC